MKQLYIVIDNSKSKQRIEDQFYMKNCHYFYYEDIADLVRISGVPMLPEFMPDEYDLCIHLKKKGNKFTNFAFNRKDIHGNLWFSTEPGSDEQTRTSKELSLCVIL